jgi:hypothetical protein
MQKRALAVDGATFGVGAAMRQHARHTVEDAVGQRAERGEDTAH